MATASVEEESINENNNEAKVKVHEDTNFPDKAWVKIKKTIKVSPVEPLPLTTPIYPDKVILKKFKFRRLFIKTLKFKIRFVCISDTHDYTTNMEHPVPNGDILIHAGDFSRRGRIDEIDRFNKYLESLDKSFKYKVVIAGMNKLCFE